MIVKVEAMGGNFGLGNVLPTQAGNFERENAPVTLHGNFALENALVILRGNSEQAKDHGLPPKKTKNWKKGELIWINRGNSDRESEPIGCFEPVKSCLVVPLATSAFVELWRLF